MKQMIKYILYTTLVMFFISCGCREPECPNTDFGVYDDHYPNNLIVFENGYGDTLVVELEEGGFIAEEGEGATLGLGCGYCDSRFRQEGTAEINGYELEIKHWVYFSGPPTGEISFDRLDFKFGDYIFDFLPEDSPNNFSLNEGFVTTVAEEYELRENENIPNCFIGVMNNEDLLIDTVFYSRNVGLVEFNFQDTAWKRIF